MNEDVPYNNDNFYPLNDKQKLPFQFMNTHPSKLSKKCKRPLSAHTKLTEDQNARYIITKRNQINQEIRRSTEEGSYIAASATKIKGGVRGLNYQYRECQEANNSKFMKSPSKFQKRLLLNEKKKEKWSTALKREKEYLYEEALKFKKEKNSKTTENRKLGVRCKYLEKEVKKRDSMIQNLMKKPLQYPAYTSPSIQSKQTMEALQKSIESNLVINLKKLIEDQKAELASKEETIKGLKMDMRGTYLREIKAERNAFEEEAMRMRNTVDTFISQVGGVDQVLNIKAYIDDQQEIIKDLEGQKDSQVQIYQAKYDECLKIEKKLINAEMERNEAHKEIEIKERQLEDRQREITHHLKNYESLKKSKKESEIKYESQINDINNILTQKISDINNLN